MSAQAIGGYVFKQALVRGRQASGQARESLRRIIEETPGPQTTAMLIAKAAVRLGEIEAVLTEIEQIAAQARGTGSLEAK